MQQYPYPYTADRGLAGGGSSHPQQYMGNGQQDLTSYGQPPQYGASTSVPDGAPAQYGMDYRYGGSALDGAPSNSWMDSRYGGPASAPDGYAQQPLEEEPLKVSMVVPEGAQPGMKLTYAAPDGQELRLTVPEGVPPGSIMTLTQDPVTKAWRCMAEPADVPSPAQEPPPPQAYEQPSQVYSAPAPMLAQAPSQAQADRAIAASSAPTQVFAPNPAPAQASVVQAAQMPTHIPPVQTYHGSTASTTTYPTGQAPTVISRTSYVQPMPVNLSYVPPPAACGTMQMGASVAMQPGQVAPRVTTYSAPPATLGTDPAQFNPPRQIPGLATDGMYEQRPSSYTPPPVPLMQSPPSYVPPPQMTIMEQRPSYTPLPQVPVPSVAAMNPSMMATTAKVQPAQFTGTLVVGQTPSYVPPPVMQMPTMQQNPSYVPPPVTYSAPPNNPSYVPQPVPMAAPSAPAIDGASVQLPAGFPPHGPSIHTLPQPIGPAFATPGLQPGQPCLPMQPGMTIPMPTGTATAGPAPMGQPFMQPAPQPQMGLAMPTLAGLQPPAFIGVGPLQTPGYTMPGLGAPMMGGPMPMAMGGAPPPYPMQATQFGPDGMAMQVGMTQPHLQQPMGGMPQPMLGGPGFS